MNQGLTRRVKTVGFINQATYEQIYINYFYKHLHKKSGIYEGHVKGKKNSRCAH